MLGGWVAAINDKFVQQENGEVSLKEVMLLKPREPRRKEHHLYVSDSSHRSSPTIIHEVVASLIEFITQRTEIDKELASILKPFVVLSPAADLTEVHRVICNDLDLEAFAQEYDNILQSEDIDQLRIKKLPPLISILSNSEFFKTITTALSRILAAKPQSSDVERLISCSNILKSPGRSSMNDFLH